MTIPTPEAALAALKLATAYLASLVAPAPAPTPVAVPAAVNLAAFPPLAKVRAAAVDFDPAAKSVDVVVTIDRATPATIVGTLRTRDGSGPTALKSGSAYTTTVQPFAFQPGGPLSQRVTIPLKGRAAEGGYFEAIIGFPPGTPYGGGSTVRLTAKAGAAAPIARDATTTATALPAWPSTAPTYVMDIGKLKWSQCGAAPDVWGVGCDYLFQPTNGETAIYASATVTPSAEPPIFVKDGKLVLHSQQLATPFTYQGKTFQHGASVLTAYKVPATHFRTGWAEVCGRMPDRKGSWPAFWLFPADNQWTAEIDVYEGFNFNSAFKSGSMIHHSLHGDNGRWKWDSGYLQPGPTTLDSADHCYGIVVTPTTLTYYLDRVPDYQTINPFPATTWSPILNVAVKWSGIYAGGTGDFSIASLRIRTER